MEEEQLNDMGQMPMATNNPMEVALRATMPGQPKYPFASQQVGNRYNQGIEEKALRMYGSKEQRNMQ